MLELLNEISDTAKRKEKQSILSETTNVDLTQKVCLMAYDPHYDYYIKEFDMPTRHFDAMSLDEALDALHEEFTGGKLRGNAAHERMTELLSNLSEDDAEVFSRVVKGDLRSGISASTINKVWTDLIYIHPYARCSSYNEKNLANIDMPCIIQTKMDGLYVDIMVFDDHVEYRSRQAGYLPFGDEDFDNELIKNFSGKVLQGETLIVGDGDDVLERQEGNGILNRDEVDPSQTKFVCWDLIDIDDFQNHKTDIPYYERLQELDEGIDLVDNAKLELVDGIIVDNTDDIIAYFKDQINAGHEGAVIKNRDFKWKHGTLKSMIKMKIIFDCELVITDWFYGDAGTKYEHAVGRIQVESSDGHIKFNVGTGFSDKQRFDLLDTIDDMVSRGTIVKVKGNGLVTNKLKPDYYSIYLPRIVEFRNDKNVADSLEEIEGIINSYTETLQNII